jgi:hypothetical protein
MSWKVQGPNYGMANIFLSSKISIPPLEPTTQSYVEWVTGDLGFFPEGKRAGVCN